MTKETIIKDQINIIELQKQAFDYIKMLPQSKLSSAVDYLEFLVDKEDLSQNERLAQALVEVARDRRGEKELPTLNQVLEVLKHGD